MLRSADAGWTWWPTADDLVSRVQPTKRRLNATRVTPITKRATPREGLLSQRLPSYYPPARMRELTEIDSPTEHACGQPATERLHVLEPVSGRWSWIRVFGCCNVVAVEPLNADEKVPTPVKRAA